MFTLFMTASKRDI